MKYILVSLFLVTYIFSRDINSAYFPKWKLEVKNEFGTDEEIVLKAGQYTKVTFVVSNENDYTYYERFFDSSKFRIFLNDDNLVTLKEEYEINPFESLEYTTYIGLNCENQINTKEYSFTFSSKEEENSDENTPKLKVVSTTVKIDKTEVNTDEETEIRRKFTICAKAGPFNRDLKYKKEDEKVLFKENFEKFVDNLSTGQKIEDNLGLGGLIVESTYREKRFSIDINEDKAEEEKEVEKVEEDKKEKEAEKIEDDKKEKEDEKVEEDKKEKENEK
jgi:hypothetical protein